MTVWRSLPGRAPAISGALDWDRSTVYRYLRLLERHKLATRTGRTWDAVGTLDAARLAEIWPRVGVLQLVKSAYRLTRLMQESPLFPAEHREDMKTIRYALLRAEMDMDR